MLGINSALETFASQAAGAGNLELCGLYLNRNRVVLAINAIPVCAILFNAESILIAIK